MKQTRSHLFVLMCLFTAMSLSAQPVSKKPLLFRKYAAVLPCSASQLSTVFSQKKGDETSIDFNGVLLLKGSVINTISKFNGALQTVVIQLPAFSNSLFTISKRKENGKADVYIGHLYNSNYADGYQLKQGKSTNYELVKITSDQVLQPCTF